MSIVWTVIIGFIAGLVARMLKPGNDKLGLVWTSLLGIGGALLATFAGQTLGWYQVGETAGFIGAVIGAIVLLLIYGAVRANKRG